MAIAVPMSSEIRAIRAKQSISEFQVATDH